MLNQQLPSTQTQKWSIKSQMSILMLMRKMKNLQMSQKRYQATKIRNQIKHLLAVLLVKSAVNVVNHVQFFDFYMKWKYITNQLCLWLCKSLFFCSVFEDIFVSVLFVTFITLCQDVDESPPFWCHSDFSSCFSCFSESFPSMIICQIKNRC